MISRRLARSTLTTSTSSADAELLQRGLPAGLKLSPLQDLAESTYVMRIANSRQLRCFPMRSDATFQPKKNSVQLKSESGGFFCVNEGDRRGRQKHCEPGRQKFGQLVRRWQLPRAPHRLITPRQVWRPRRSALLGVTRRSMLDSATAMSNSASRQSEIYTNSREQNPDPAAPNNDR